MTHSQASTKGRAKGVPPSACDGKLTLIDSRKQWAGPRREVQACRSCGNVLSIEGGVVVGDSANYAGLPYIDPMADGPEPGA